jgi:MoaA/NifB/PqqE/SkfB family radical SAM enzyme
MSLPSRSLDFLKQYCNIAFLKKGINHALSKCRQYVSIRRDLCRKEFTAVQDEYGRRDSIVPYFPKDLTIETTTDCNLNCVMCWRHSGGILDRKHLPTEQLEQLVPYLRQAQFIQLHGCGEPLLSPAFWRALELIGTDSKETKCVSINTNGLLLNKDNIERLINSPLENINVSLDAATPNTYRRIRGADFNVLLNNIRNFVRMRDQAGAKLPLLYLNMTLMRANLEELPQFIRLVSQLKGDRAYFWLMHDSPDHVSSAWRIERDGWTFDYKEQLPSRCPALTNRMVRLALDLASELGVSVEAGTKTRLWLPEESQNSQGEDTPVTGADRSKLVVPDSEECLEDMDCDSPWRWLVIPIDGQVRACCHMQKPIGDLHRETIEEIWNGKMMQEVRIAIRERSLHPVCKGAVCKYSRALEARQVGKKSVAAPCG